MRTMRLERKILREVRREGRITNGTSRMLLMNIATMKRRMTRLDPESSIVMTYSQV